MYHTGPMRDAAKAPAPEWSTIDTVMLDMDGTLLDLAFDNHFWVEHVPTVWGERRGMSYAEAFRELEPIFRTHQGTLNWYSLDFWSETLGLDIYELKHEMREGVRYLPDAERFLQRIADIPQRAVLMTNAHHGVLEIKVARTGLDRYLDALYCSHDFGVPKEDRTFWSRLAQREDYDPARTLFVDDSLPVLRSARAYGIGHVYSIRHPDSSRDPRSGETMDGFPLLGSLLELFGEGP